MTQRAGLTRKRQYLSIQRMLMNIESILIETLNCIRQTKFVINIDFIKNLKLLYP